MRINRSILFFMQFATIGVVAAVLYLYFYPNPKPEPLLQQQFMFKQAQAGLPLKTNHADAIQIASASVVQIYTQRRITNKEAIHNDPFFEEFSDQSESQRNQLEPSLGSGVIVSEYGYIVTNYHVIASAEYIAIALNDGRKTHARIVGIDSESDLAVLKIELTDLPYITLARYDELRVGQIVLAIGNPFGVGQSATSGIISALDRHSLDISIFENFIQTDAAINPGNSGGALINTNGHLIGINTAIFTGSGGSQGIGFAIPVDLMQEVVSDIIMHGKVIRGWAGINIAYTIDKKILITKVIANSPAAQANIQVHDIILKLNNIEVSDPRQLLFSLSRLTPGQEVSIVILRNGVELQKTMMIGTRPLVN